MYDCVIIVMKPFLTPLLGKSIRKRFTNSSYPIFFKMVCIPLFYTYSASLLIPIFSSLAISSSDSPCFLKRLIIFPSILFLEISSWLLLSYFRKNFILNIHIPSYIRFDSCLYQPVNHKLFLYFQSSFIYLHDMFIVFQTVSLVENLK